MKFLVFVLILWVVYLFLRSWVNRSGTRRSRFGHDGSYPSGPADSYANPYAPRDSDGDCRSDSANGSDSASGADCGSGDGGGSGGGSSD